MATSRKSTRPTPPECPVCGADVPPGSRACPECGADERTGWDDEATRYDGLDLPDDAFENESASPRKHSRPPTPRINGIALHWWLLAVALLVVVAIGIFRL